MNWEQYLLDEWISLVWRNLSNYSSSLCQTEGGWPLPQGAGRACSCFTHRLSRRPAGAALGPVHRERRVRLLCRNAAVTPALAQVLVPGCDFKLFRPCSAVPCHTAVPAGAGSEWQPAFDCIVWWMSMVLSHSCRRTVVTFWWDTKTLVLKSIFV